MKQNCVVWCGYLTFKICYVYRIISNACQRRKNTKANKKATIKLRNKTESDVSTAVSTSEAVDI